MVSFLHSFLHSFSTQSQSLRKKRRRRLRNPRNNGIVVNLPEVLIHEILIRLPIKSLIKFRSVSKEWNSTIRSRFFTRMHFRRQQEDDQDYNLRLMLYNNFLTSCYMVNCNSMDKAIKTNPGFYLEMFFDIYGSCHGLLLVVIQNSIYLWNPTTKEHRELPQVKRSPKIFIHACGFGYDQSCKDFKVLCITRYYKNKHEITDWLNLYTGRLNSWKKLNKLNEVYDCMIPVKEKLYFVPRKLSFVRNRTYIISYFDITCEKFGELSLPNYGNDNDGRYWSVTSLRGKLSAISCSSKSINVGHDVWIMYDSGVNESWTKEVTILWQCWRPSICFPAKDGKIMLHYYNTIEVQTHTTRPMTEIITYDIEKKKGDICEIHGAPRCFRSVTYVETLISPNAVGSD